MDLLSAPRSRPGWNVFLLGNLMSGIQGRATDPEPRQAEVSQRKSQLWGQLGHLHATSFQTRLTKQGKSTFSPYEIDYIP